MHDRRWLIGLGFGTTALLRGKEFLRRAHSYMEQCVDRFEAFIDEAGLSCDKIRPGFLRVATTDTYVRGLRAQVELMRSLGFGEISWIDAATTREMVDSERYLGAIWEPVASVCEYAIRACLQAEGAFHERILTRVRYR